MVIAGWGKLRVRFCGGLVVATKPRNMAGGARMDEHIYYETSISLLLVRLRGK